MDDFGTGYSSLATLRRFTVDTLKIDRSFISDIESDNESRAIVQLILDLAHMLGSATIAEGVESASQAQILRRMGCHQAQGYYFAAPLSATEAEATLGGLVSRTGPPNNVAHHNGHY